MTKSKFARTTLVSAVATLALSGVAFANSADISTTGPDSYNSVTIENSNHVDISNHNDVTVNNSNTQSAQSGDASVKDNTTGGSALSGQASNSNSVETTIGVNNNSSACNCSDGKGGGAGGGGNNVGSNSGSTAKGGGSGVGGGGSKSVGTLPETGARIPVDVSALRNLLNPASQTTPLTGAVKANRTLSTVVLGLAAVLSLFAAIGTAVYSTNRTLKV